MKIEPTKAARTLYGAAPQGSSYAHVRASVYDARKTHARQKNDELEAKRLEAEEQELTQLCGELRLPDDKALALGTLIRDRQAFGAIHEQKASRAGQTIAPKTNLSERDRALLTEHYGEKYGDVVSSAATKVGALLATKPTLAAAIRTSGAALDVDCIRIVGDAVVALGEVKPIAAPPA